MTKQTIDIHQQITNQIIEALETVSLDNYQAPFASLASGKLPANPMTQQRYHGINTLVLWLHQQKNNFRSHEWGTFRQWKTIGATVKKGERSTMIIFYKRVEKKDIEENEEEFYHCLKSYCVFNADQVDGYTPDIDTSAGVFGTVEQVEAIDSFVHRTGAVIENDQDSAAFYPMDDKISMPKKELFFDTNQSATENYYAVLLHELTHWTGGSKRLDREQALPSVHQKEGYAFEELIAELGSAFLCSQFGINQAGRDDHAIYIKSWLTALRNDKKYIFKAASNAQKAVDYLNTVAEN